MATQAEQDAEAARQLLANPIYQQSFNEVREALIEEIESSSVIDAEERNQLGLSLAALSGVKLAIEDRISTAMLDADDMKK